MIAEAVISPIYCATLHKWTGTILQTPPVLTATACVQIRHVTKLLRYACILITISSMRVAWYVLPLLIGGILCLISFVGCAVDDCDIGEVACVDGAVAHCIHHSCHTPGCTARNSWVRDAPCSQVCVESGSAAFCALSTKHSSECGGSRDGYCDGSSAVRCKRGYAISSRDCAEQGHACYEYDTGTEAYSLCAFPGLDDPRCPLDGGLEFQSVAEWVSGARSNYCDGSRLVTCQNLAVDDERECAIACVNLDEGDAFCASSADPDPRCQDGKMGENSLSCSDGSAARCRQDGYLVCLDAKADDQDAGISNIPD